MSPVGGCVFTHPAVVARYADHGVDLRRTVPWTHPFRQAGAETVLAEDPPWLELLVGTDLPGDPLAVRVDRAGAVCETAPVED